jgi:hypothetical protein
MAKQIDVSLKSAKADVSLVTTLIFKAVEIGTLTTESALKALDQCDLSVHRNSDYFHQDKIPTPLPMINSPLPNNQIQTLNYNNSDTTTDSIPNNEDNDFDDPMDNDITHTFDNFIAHPTTAWLKSYEASHPDANSQECKNLLNGYKSLLSLTENSSNVKFIPKCINNFKRAFLHIQNIFIPRLVCFLTSPILLTIPYLFLLTFRLCLYLGPYIIFSFSSFKLMKCETEI